jgi:hypothetical protein
MHLFSSRFLLILSALSAAVALHGWDAPGHRIVNQLALDSLPADFPAFVREPAAVGRIAFLAGEPDRWSHALDLPLKHDSWPEHYLDVEQLADAGLDPKTVSSLRYDFVAAFTAGRAAHPENFQHVDALNVVYHTDKLPGLLPWVVTEYYGRLKAAFSSLQVYQELGTPQEIANAQADVIYTMGIMGHFVGDLFQPLHTTVYHDGWVGPNPHGYFTGKFFHSWIDSGLIAKARITVADLAPRVVPAEPLPTAAREDGRDPVFVTVMDCLLEQNKFVEPLYQLEKAGKLGRGETPVAPEGRALIENQLHKGGELLGALWLTAWKSAPPEEFLRKQLLKRQAAAAVAK